MSDEHELTPREPAEPEPGDARNEPEGGDVQDEPALSLAAIAVAPNAKDEGAEGGAAKAGCPVWGLHMDYRCWRPIHAAPEGTDARSVCLMHSKDPAKLSGSLYEKFWTEFEATLDAAGDGVALFDGFVFPEIDFRSREFHAMCIFSQAIFKQRADFYRAKFKEGAYFIGAKFKQRPNFTSAIFTEPADFGSAKFTQGAYFIGAEFTKGARFAFAKFTGDADFNSAKFTQGADFGQATFTQPANFTYANFRGTADWRLSEFLDQADFRRTEFDPEDKERPSAVFSLAKFSKPGDVIIDGVDLSRALFHNCDISAVWFTSSVNWAERDKGRGLAVFDETIPLGNFFAKGLRRAGGERDLGAIAQIYQQLKKNYDARLDTWTANDFHYGEMEMKRLAGPETGRFLLARRWLHRNLSLVALYRTASDYGNSYGRPAAWILAVLLLFTVLLPAPGVGLMRTSGSGATSLPTAETYASVWDRKDHWGPNLWREVKIEGKAAIAAIDTAGFQRNAEYVPSYPWGRVLAIVTTLLTSTLFGLFLLAIRRQFKR